MKKSTIYLLIAIFIIYLCHFFVILLPVINSERQLIINVNDIQDRVAYVEKQVQDIQDNYVSFEALQPVLTDIEDYQMEVDRIRNNLNDFNNLWAQMFGYEQEQYVMRGR